MLPGQAGEHRIKVGIESPALFRAERQNLCTLELRQLGPERRDAIRPLLGLALTANHWSRGRTAGRRFIHGSTAWSSSSSSLSSPVESFAACRRERHATLDAPRPRQRRVCSAAARQRGGYLSAHFSRCTRSLSRLFASGSFTNFSSFGSQVTLRFTRVAMSLM